MLQWQHSERGICIQEATISQGAKKAALWKVKRDYLCFIWECLVYTVNHCWAGHPTLAFLRFCPSSYFSRSISSSLGLFWPILGPACQFIGREYLWQRRSSMSHAEALSHLNSMSFNIMAGHDAIGLDVRTCAKTCSALSVRHLDSNLLKAGPTG